MSLRWGRGRRDAEAGRRALLGRRQGPWPRRREEAKRTLGEEEQASDDLHEADIRVRVCVDC